MKTPTTVKTYVGYTRVSRLGDRELEDDDSSAVGQQDDPEATEKAKGKARLRSVDQQKNAIIAWAKSQEREPVIVWLDPDLDESGKDLNRPSMTEALRMVRAGEADGLVAARLDRITRSVSDLDHLMRAADAEGWSLTAIDLNLDNSTANGRLIWGLMGNINQWYLDRSREQWRVARADAVKRGNHLGARVPFGYTKRAKGDSLAGQLVPDPTTSWIVPELFARRAAGESFTTIGKWARTTGAGKGQIDGWTAAFLSHMIGNETYLGVIQDKGTGERKEGAHPALVDPVTFAACQRRRGVRRFGTKTGDDDNGDRLLLGLLRCASCRYGMTYYRQAQVNGVRGHYRCRRGAQVHDCPDPASVTAEAGQHSHQSAVGIEDYVVSEMFARIPDGDILMAPFGADSGVGDLATAVQVAKAELLRYADDRELEEVMGRMAYLEGAKTRKLALDEAEQDYDDAVRERGEDVPGKLLRLRDVWEEWTIEERRDGLATVVQAVFVQPGPYVSSARTAAIEALREHPGAPLRTIERETGVDRVTLRNARELLATEGEPTPLSDRVHIVWADEADVAVPRAGVRGWVHPTPFVFPGDARPHDAGVAVG